MTMNLDMPLDDLIKINKFSGRGGRGRGRGGRGRGRGRGRGAGDLVINSSSNFNNNNNVNGSDIRGVRTAAFLRPRRPSAFQVAKSFVSRRPNGLRRDMFEDAVGSALGIETSTKLFISNLDYGVSNEDIKELFSELGELKHYGIHYDRSGRSIGTADVVFSRRQDALAAIKRYNNVQLDGKPMKIELIGTNILPTKVVGGYGGGPAGRGRAAPTARGRGRGSGFRRFRGRGRGRGGRRTDKKVLTAEELDTDLEKYHKDAMQTS